MRLVQVAKILGISGQDLRKELSDVDFGVKPTDREMADSIAMGVIRFVARKRGITIDWATIDTTHTATEDDTEAAEKAPEDDVAPQVKTEEKKAPVKPENLNVMRKLTLEGVSRDRNR
jgi:hypothetical protein